VRERAIQQGLRVGWITLTGVRSSCDTLATKSRRTFSSRRMSLMSSITRMVPPVDLIDAAARQHLRAWRQRQLRLDHGSRLTVDALHQLPERRHSHHFHQR
jgi:hypothetical protein